MIHVPWKQIVHRPLETKREMWLQKLSQMPLSDDNCITKVDTKEEEKIDSQPDLQRSLQKIREEDMSNFEYAESLARLLTEGLILVCNWKFIDSLCNSHKIYRMIKIE